MNTLRTHGGLAVLASLLALGLAISPAQAQRVQSAGTRISPATQGLFPFMQVAPGLNLQQAAYNTMLMGRAYSNFPPYAFGFAPPYSFGYSPGSFGGLPTPGFSAGLAISNQGNPFSTGGGGVGISPLFNPYGYGGGGTATMTAGGGYGGGGYGGYPSDYPVYSYADPYGGYLRGAADVINAEGRWLVNFQQSRSLRQDVKRAQLENRRRIFDEYMYEQAHRVPYAEMVAHQNELNLRLFLNSPSPAQLGSADALNAILQDAEKLTPRNPPAIALDNDVLHNINVTSPNGTTGNVSILRDLNNLHWPLAFKSSLFQPDVDVLKTYLPQAIQDAKADHQPDRSVIDKLLLARDNLANNLRAHVNDLPPSQYIDARHFLNHLSDGLTALENGTAGK